MSHVDIDTSCEKVVDLPHQAIIACLKQLYLLQHKVGVEGKVGGSSHVHNRVQSSEHVVQCISCASHCDFYNNGYVMPLSFEQSHSSDGNTMQYS